MVRPDPFPTSRERREGGSGEGREMREGGSREGKGGREETREEE